MVMVAILALQGAFIEHERSLDGLGVDHFEIRQKAALDRPFDALIIPGGELRDRIEKGLPVFGTCAGLIVLAKNVIGGAPSIATMDITVKRNAYGRQLGSFYTEDGFDGLGDIPMTFIRAPYIDSVGEGVEILSEVDGRIVVARQGRQLVTAFHPELTDDLSVHRYFLEEVAGLKI